MYRQRFKSDEQKFWEKALVGGDGCWKWMGATNQQGRGTAALKGRFQSAPRVAYSLMRGSVHRDLNVLHRCDNPSCVNPKHLFLGTQKDNMRDCVRKGRFRDGQHKGESHPLARLTAADVASIRERFALGAKNAELSQTFSVSKSQIYRIVSGQRWK